MREMKDSGISWVGEIPKGWGVNRAKYCFVNTKEIAGCMSDRYERLALTMNGVIKRSKDDSNGLQPEKFETYQILRPDELVFKLIDLQNVSTSRVGLSPYLGLVSPAYIILKSNKRVLPAFAEKYFLMLWKNQIFNALGDAGVRSNLNSKDLLELSISFPSIAEQQRIAEFLDRECGKIDGLKADIQAQIDTLEQYKRSVITEAVTHGLNPSAPMKDSGVPWVGSIPKHWNCCSLKYNYNTISGATPNSNDISLWDGEIVWVTPADYKTKDVYVCSGARKITYKGYLSCSTTLIKQGNIIFSKRAPIGSVAINKVELCTSQGCLSVVSKTGNVNNKYFYYLFSVNDETFNLFGSGTTFKEISAKDFLNVKFPLPSLDEQQEIADYLDNKCAEIEQIIADKKTQIETLDGYKKSLIYECVTGKKEIV